MTIPRKVAVIGAGDIGVGWAALCASAGWPVAIFDLNPGTMDRASAEVERRTRALVALDRAPASIVERGLTELVRAKFFSEAVQDADWVIESIHEDVVAKQKLLTAIEQAVDNDVLISSSSSGLSPTEIFGRCRRLDRCLVTHPLNPPELIPLVEVVPETRTSAASLTRAAEYLRALGRFPIVLKKAIPGYVVGRVAAAVWRECIDLVLRGVISVDDLDRAVSLGPAIGWAAAGPHLTYHLAAGEGGIRIFTQHLLASFESWWQQLAHWAQLDPEQQRALIQSIEKAYKGKVEFLREARDRRLSAILMALEQSRAPSGSESG
ncbi:MAG TPA: 3-hydroxyacyl-CoA dehydrogenase NAD-binding domain-containing protein [Gemmatimonadales bacterium]|jgi:3-hydroxyacyl-CoA dehydrogenase|nr:3-hydroxyacyl-CoA dehydrogenase NAD-binding domain-containing protein [Gemmatimonadales bacterium]